MADYIYLLDSRLSPPQQKAIQTIREIARAKGLTVFLVGGAVRDLTSGSPVRDLDVAVQGNALKLRKELEKAGAVITGEWDTMQSLFVSFPGSVRMEIGSTLSVIFPKPGKPVVKPANILDDLRRRDFTANAMALSLNEGSYGLLMDPLNGVADIENRELRLVSNYGFIEDPVRMIRAVRYSARLGWQMEEKTQARYDTGKNEDYIAAMSAFQRGYEAEEIVHEEDPLRVMRKLEQEGWMKLLTPVWNSTKANVGELEKLREAQMQLQMRGIHADSSAAQFPLLTAKLAPKEVASLKESFPRQGFVRQIEDLEADAKRFASEFSAKNAAAPSAAWKMLMAARPEAVLWVAYSSKSAALQSKFKSFYTEWPQARQRIPYVQMQEMRIVPELAGYDELVEKLFFELMDNKLGTVEEIKAFLEPYSPPAPPPPVHLRRPRAAKKDTKAAKARKKADAGESSDDELDGVAAAAPAKAEGDRDLAEAKDAQGDAAAGTNGSSTARKGSSARKAAPANTIAPAKAIAPAKFVAPAKLVAPARSAAPVKASAKETAAKSAAGKQGNAKAAAPAKPAVKKANAAPPAKPLAKKVAPGKANGKPAKKAPATASVKLAAKASKAKSSPKAPARPAAITHAKAKPPSKLAAKSGGKARQKTPVKTAPKRPAKLASKKRR